VTWNEAITAGCKLAGITQAELARRLGYTYPSGLTTMIRGYEVPSVEKFARTFRALDVGLEWDADRGWQVVGRP